MINLNRRHNGATVINISDNVTMKLYCDILLKSGENNSAPQIYIDYEKTVLFNVELLSNTKKQKKKVKHGYYLDHVGKGDVRDLLDVKDKIYNIICQLKNNEVLTIMGTDKRRHKIYEYYIERDRRFDECVVFYDEAIVLFNPFDDSWRGSFVKTLVRDDEKPNIFDWKQNKKVVENRNKKWKELCK